MIESLPETKDCDKDSWQLVRDWFRDPSVKLQPIFTKQSGQLYGSNLPRFNSEAAKQSFPLNPAGLDTWDHTFYHEKLTAIAQFRNASLVGDPGIVRTGCKIFVPSPQTLVPLHSLLDMPMIHVQKVSHAISVVQMSCDNYYRRVSSSCISERR